MSDTYRASFNSGGDLPDPDRDPQFYAGVPAKRLLAWVVDVALVWGLAILVSLLTLGIGFLILGFVIAVIDFLYRVICLNSGSSTVGMSLTGIEVRTFNGQRLGFGLAVAHTLLFYLMLVFVVVQLISVLMMGGSRYGRGLHDVILGTAVINKPL